MSNLISTVPDLPVFANGVPLSATSLNAISLNQEYLHQRYNRTIPAQPVMRLETPADGIDTSRRSMYFVHLQRYLHWHFRQDAQVAGRLLRMKINGQRAAEVSDSSPLTNSGVIDLNGTSLDGNAYGLVVGKAYEVEWSTVSGSLSGIYGDAYAYDTFECATNNATLALPAGDPTFSGGGTPTAAQLNGLVDNCKFLLSGQGLAQTPGFRDEDMGIRAPGGATTNSSFLTHFHPYTVVRFDIDMGYNANTIDVYVHVNGNQVYTDSKTKGSTGGGVIHQYKLFLANGSFGLTVGVPYRVEVSAWKSAWDDYTRMKTHFVGESISNIYPSWG